MGEAGLMFFLMLAASEPTLQFAFPVGEMQRAAVAAVERGFGLRWRIGVAGHHAVRLRVDWLKFHLRNEPPMPGESVEQARYSGGAEFLWRGQDWRPGFYGGGGLDFVDNRRSKRIQDSSDPFAGPRIIEQGRKQGPGLGATAGYGTKAGPGLITSEAHASWARGSQGNGELVFTFAVGYRWNWSKRS